MYITKFQVSNFKSYLDSGEIELKPGFNIITGQNSAGKTALLEAMALQFTGNQHRSLRTVPTPGIVPNQESIVRVTLSLKREELIYFWQGQTLLLPEPPQGFAVPGQGAYGNDPGALLRWLSQERNFLLTLNFKKVGGSETWSTDGPALGKYPIPPPNTRSSVRMLQVVIQDNQFRHIGGQEGPPNQYLTTQLSGALRTRIYRFLAERFNIGRCAFGNNSVLTPDARNLPEVVNTLNEDPRKLLALNCLVSEILPQVRQISVRAIPGSQVQIVVWPHDPATQRADLAIPLDECGSGVGQVLAVLYVVMTSDHPQVILIDEPQSFLHPGAVRKLIEVLKRYPQHQYILATHSPTVITAADPATLTITRVRAVATSLQAINPGSAKDLQTYLLEIGARLSDVFGADSILWVEGQTEEACLPRILEIIANRSLKGTAVVGIRQTGDITGRDKKKILAMYRRLSAANSLLPPAIAFVLDRECLSEQQSDNIARAGRDGAGREMVHFLPRRMYENYLLNAEAIAQTANGIDGFRREQVPTEEVQRLLDAKLGDRRYYCPGQQAVANDHITNVNGARVLKDIFDELSENSVSYEKTTHSVAITEWILQHHPEEFRGLAAWLVQVLAQEPAFSSELAVVRPTPTERESS